MRPRLIFRTPAPSAVAGLLIRPIITTPSTRHDRDLCLSEPAHSIKPASKSRNANIFHHLPTSFWVPFALIKSASPSV